MAKVSLKNINNLIRNSVKNATDEQRFMMELNKHIQKSEIRKERSKTYNPSSLNCLRSMFYQRSGQISDDNLRDVNLIKINKVGSFIHEMLQEAAVSMCKEENDYEWIDVETYIKEKKIKHLEVVSKDGYETKCYHKVLNMSFKCDGIIRIKDKYIIWEVKSETCFKNQNRKDVDDYHKNQASCYSLAFKINNVLFTYVNRDNLSDKAFMLTVTPSMQQDVIDKINTCEAYVSENEIPSKEESKACMYCPYKKKCDEDCD